MLQIFHLDNTKLCLFPASYNLSGNKIMAHTSAPFIPLVEKIKAEGKSLEGGILKVDGFINHRA